MNSINASLQSQIGMLAGDLSDFKAEMGTGLSGIMSSLDTDQAELMNELGAISYRIDDLSLMLDGANASILGSIESD